MSHRNAGGGHAWGWSGWRSRVSYGLGSVLGLWAVAAMVAVRTSRWYVVPAGTALIVLLMSGVAGTRVFVVSFAERLLETAAAPGWRCCSGSRSLPGCGGVPAPERDPPAENP